jgi:hypothetical protein
MVAADHHLSAARVGYPLQLVDTAGRIVRSLGADPPEYDPQESVRMLKVLASGSDGASAWSIGRTDYRIERWDTAGDRIAAFQRRAPWFEPHVVRHAVSPTQPPQPIVFDARLDAGGRLWVAVAVPSARWREALTESPDGSLQFDESKGQDLVLEVLDVERGTLLTSRRLADFSLARFVGDELVATYREDEAGFPFLDIWRVSFVPEP